MWFDIAIKISCLQRQAFKSDSKLLNHRLPPDYRIGIF